MTNPSSQDNCTRIIEQLKKDGGKCFQIVHHWDTDGIISAVLLEKFLKKILKKTSISFVVPKIGEHSINAFDIPLGKNYSLLITDYGIPINDIEKAYADKGVKTYIIDHHKNAIPPNHKSIICNPIAYGATEDEFPSTTVVIKKLIDADADELLVAIGIVGDLGQRISQGPYYSWVKRVLYKNNISLQEAIEITKLIDSCYKLLDKKCILHTIETLREKNPTSVLNDKLLRNNLEQIKDEVEKIIKDETSTESFRNIVLVNAKSKYYVTSEVGRRLASEYPDKIIVLYNRVETMETTYIYVRSQTYQVGEIIKCLKNKGYIVGGKDHVFVVTCKNNCGKERNMIINLLMEKMCKQ